jgi:LAO/AO transport system kinase
LGGLSAKIIEMVDVVKSSGFDYIFVETVGVGQSEVEIVNLADITIVVLVPESGDEIQSLKSGLMEIADIFVVNKADRPGSDKIVNTIKKLVNNSHRPIPVFKTQADQGTGVDELRARIQEFGFRKNKRQDFLMLEKVWKLIEAKRMADIDRKDLEKTLIDASGKKNFNIYRFVNDYF